MKISLGISGYLAQQIKTFLPMQICMQISTIKSFIWKLLAQVLESQFQICQFPMALSFETDRTVVHDDTKPLSIPQINRNDNKVTNYEMIIIGTKVSCFVNVKKT